MRRYTWSVAIALCFACLPLFSGEPLRIAYITDTHYGHSAATNADMERVIEDINSQDSLDFVLMGGDLTHHGTDLEIAKAYEIMSRLRIPYRLVPGNHDTKWSESGCNTFLRTFGYEQFEFEAGGYRFLGSSCGPEMRFEADMVPRNSMNWLRSLQKDKPVIFLDHYPLDKGLSNWFEVRRELLRLDCRFSITGHLHGNAACDYDGLPGIIGTSTLGGSAKTPKYNIIVIKDSVLTVSQRRLPLNAAPVTDSPWYEKELLPVVDTVHYDEDGLPEDYPFMTYKENRLYPQVTECWSKTEDANIGTSFACDGKRAWYATSVGKVVAVNLDDGEEIWHRQLPGKVFSTPAVDKEFLVIGCTDGSVYAMSAATGEPLWTAQTGGAIVSSPVIFKKMVFIGNSKGQFRALRLKDGKLLWVYSKVKGFCDGAPYVDGEQIIFTDWGRCVYSLDPFSGSVLWIWKRAGSVLTSCGYCTPLKSGNRVFVVSPDRRTYCLSATDGKVLYVVDGGRESFAMSADKKTVFVKTMDGKAFAFPTQIPLKEVTGSLAPDSPSQGRWMPDAPVLAPSQKYWSVESGLGNDLGSSALTACENLLLIPSENGEIHALDAKTGEKLWKHKVGIGLVNPVSAWRAGDKIRILASCTNGKIELLETNL